MLKQINSHKQEHMMANPRIKLCKNTDEHDEIRSTTARVMEPLLTFNNIGCKHNYKCLKALTHTLNSTLLIPVA